MTKAQQAAKERPTREDIEAMWSPSLVRKYPEKAFEVMTRLAALPEEPDPAVIEALAVAESALAFWNNGSGHHDAAWVSRMAYNMGDALQRAATALRLLVVRFSIPQRPPVSPEVREELATTKVPIIYPGGTRMVDLGYPVADALLARFSFPTLDVEKLTRWLVENRRLVAGSAWEYVDSEGTAAALVAALNSGELNLDS